MAFVNRGKAPCLHYKKNNFINILLETHSQNSKIFVRQTLENMRIKTVFANGKKNSFQQSKMFAR